MKPNTPLECFRAPTGLTLALAWASLMSLYIYNDYFSMYVPGTIASMASGHLGPLGPATSGVLVAGSMLLAFPAMMIVLSVVLPAPGSRWLNVVGGVVYTIVEGATFRGPELFFKIVVALEMALTVFIVWQALHWPRRASDPSREVESRP